MINKQKENTRAGVVCRRRKTITNHDKKKSWTTIRNTCENMKNQKRKNQMKRKKKWTETDNCMPFYIKHIESDIFRFVHRYMRSCVIQYMCPDQLIRSCHIPHNHFKYPVRLHFHIFLKKKKLFLFLYLASTMLACVQPCLCVIFSSLSFSSPPLLLLLNETSWKKYVNGK